MYIIAQMFVPCCRALEPYLKGVFMGHAWVPLINISTLQSVPLSLSTAVGPVHEQLPLCMGKQ